MGCEVSGLEETAGLKKHGQKDEKGQEVVWGSHKVCARPLTVGQFQPCLPSDLATVQFRKVRIFLFLASCVMSSFSAPDLVPHSYAPLGRRLEKVSAL